MTINKKKVSLASLFKATSKISFKWTFFRISVTSIPD